MWGLLFFLFTSLVHSQECTSKLINPIDEFAQQLNSVSFRQSFDANTSAINKFCRESFKWNSDAKIAERQSGLLVKENDRTREVAQYYLGCRSDTEWMKQLREALCTKEKAVSAPRYEDLQSVRLPKNFLFLFDGMRDFNPRLGKEFGAVNLDGTEPIELNSGNAYGLKGFMVGVENASTNYELHYHVSSGFYEYQNIDSAMACANQMNRYLDILMLVDVREEPKWIAFGYSNGADRVLHFQNRMATVARPMNLVVTVDPIPQALFFPFNGLTATIGRKHPSTGRLINFYQTTDYGSAGPLLLRGKPVDQADVNTHIKPHADSKLAENGHRNHVKIASSPEIAKVIACELQKLEKINTSCDL